jgi:hypothetical protein
MGVIWGVAPFNAGIRDRIKALGVSVDYPLDGNRLPTVAEMRAALAANKDLRWEGSEAPKEGSWDASIQNGDDGTILNLEGVADPSSPPRDLWLEKGSPELIAEILEPLAASCGYLFVNNDSDYGFFFIVGPGVDPYEYIDRDEDDEEETPEPPPKRAVASGARILACPSCSKPVHPKATRCRWCGAEIQSAVSGEDLGVTPAIVKEAEEIRDWKPGPTKVPPLFSPLTWTLAVLVLAALVVDVTNRAVLMRWMGARMLNVALVPLLFWSGIMRDLSVQKSRRRETPGDAVEYYFNRIARRLYGQGGGALADHPTAAKRHANLEAQIRQWGDLEVDQAYIHKVESIGEDMAVVEADVRMKVVSYFVFPLPGHLHAGRSVTESSRPSSKLLVRRHGRWYLVNGTLTDRLDRNLIRCIVDPGRS